MAASQKVTCFQLFFLNGDKSFVSGVTAVTFYTFNFSTKCLPLLRHLLKRGSEFNTLLMKRSTFIVCYSCTDNMLSHSGARDEPLGVLDIPESKWQSTQWQLIGPK